MRADLNPKIYWVGFNLVKGIGAVRFQHLLKHFGSLEIAWQAPVEALMQAGLNQRLAERVLQVRRQVSLDQIWEQIQKKHIQVLTWDDGEYPRRLLEIDQPPPVLYLRGSISPEDQWAVATVGTRRVTVYGRQIAEEIGRFLAEHGITVVSGLARGVDAICHQAALDAGGRTIAVLGSGVDAVYPPENRTLAAKIIEQGALVSDYPVGTPPESSNFPPRNRIISGLSMATIVVEAGETSGALITAEFAAEQGRDVFAVPGSILAPQSKGANRLIEQGARPLLNLEDLVESLHLEHFPEHRVTRALIPGNENEARILKILSAEARHMDEIASLSGLPIQTVSATLTVLELKGMVRPVGGSNYISIHESRAKY